MSGSLAPRRKKPRGQSWKGNPFSASYHQPKKSKAPKIQLSSTESDDMDDQGSPPKQKRDAKEVWVMRLGEIVFVQFRNVLFLVQ